MKRKKGFKNLNQTEICECSGGRLWPFIDFVKALADYRIGEDLFFYHRIPVENE